MRKQHLFFLTFSCLLFFNLTIAQTNSASDFISFSKQNFTSKSSQLKMDNWALLQPTSSETENEITTKKSFYNKEVSNKEYYILLELLTSSATSLQVETTTIKIPNGNEFDRWVAEFESMGYNFQKVKGMNGYLFGGEKGMMIKVGINNINSSVSEWTYEVTIMVSNK